MAMTIGDMTATTGMTKAIYDKIREVMEPIEGVEGDQLDAVRDSWRKLSYAIADGVISHLKSNMEIKNIKVIDKVNVQGNSAAASSDNHHHGIDLDAEDGDLEFSEVNYPAGQGHVE